jgi:hypothetical protein
MEFDSGTLGNLDQFLACVRSPDRLNACPTWRRTCCKLLSYILSGASVLERYGQSPIRRLVLTVFGDACVHGGGQGLDCVALVRRHVHIGNRPAIHSCRYSVVGRHYLAIRLRTNHTDSVPIHVIDTVTPNGNDRIMNHPITDSA